MPELPEVETVRRDLEQVVVGRRIESVAVSGLRSVRRHGPRAGVELGRRLAGQQVRGARRCGKYILLDLHPQDMASAQDVLVVHLGMSGQLLWKSRGSETVHRHAHVVITFDQEVQLHFVDPRTFGELFVTSAPQVGSERAGEIAELAHLGFDPLDRSMSTEEFGRRLAAKRTKLKALLMDQRFVAGIGNIYTDEILFTAGLRFDRPAASLSASEVRRLKGAMVEILSEAVRLRGSSLADAQYRDLLGQLGRYQERHRAYGRQGEPCVQCGHPIVRVKHAGRSTFFCPKCQP